jgi:hypothetical protein
MEHKRTQETPTQRWKSKTRGGDKRRLPRRARKQGDTYAHGASEEREGQGEGTLSVEEAASTSSAAADNPRKMLSACAIWTARETFRRQEGNNLPTCIPLEAAACLANLFVKTSVAWPPRAPNSVTEKGINRMSGRLLTSLRSYSTAYSDFMRRGLETPDKQETTASIASFEPRMLW